MSDLSSEDSSFNENLCMEYSNNDLNNDITIGIINQLSSLETFRYSYYKSHNCHTILQIVNTILDGDILNKKIVSHINKCIESIVNCCAKDNHRIIKTIMNKLINKGIISLNNIVYVIKFIKDYDLSKSNGKFKPKSKLFIKLKKLSSPCYNQLKHNHIITILKLIKQSQKSLLYCCKYFPQHINIFLKKGKMTVKCVEYLCEYNPIRPDDDYTDECLKKVQKYSNLGLTHECLANACYACNFKLIKYLLDYRLEANRKCFDNIINSTNIGHKTKCINLIVNSGYMLTQENLKECLKNKIIIENINRFNIKVDEEISILCARYQLEPKTYKLIHTANTLAEMCRSATLTNIKKYIKKHNIIPNEECILIRCKRNNPLPTIKYLISKGAPFTYKCMVDLAFYGSTKMGCY